MSIERVMVWNGANVVFKFSLFDRNVQNKHKNSECNYVIALFNLKTNNSVRYNRLGLSKYFNTDRSKAVLLLWFLTVTCTCWPYLYFGSAIMLVTYFSKL